MNRDFKINLSAASFLAGVGLASRMISDSLFFYLSGLTLLLLIWWVSRRGRSRNMSDTSRPQFERHVGGRTLAYALIFAALLIGGVRVWIDWHIDDNLREVKLYQKKVLVEGEVFNQPVLKDLNQSFYLKVDSVRSPVKMTGSSSNESARTASVVDTQVSIPAGLLLQVKLPGLPELHWRDRVRLEGTFLTPENTEDFNYADYLMKDHVYWLLDRPSLKKVLEPAGADWGNPDWYLMELRRFFLDKTYETFSEPAGGIMAGLLIGERANIQAGILKDFQTTGLTHILAISGFNISLIINIISFMVAKRDKWNRYFITMALIAAFVIITGASASVLRAAVMGGLVLSVKTLGRSSQILKIILLSGVLMTLINPRIVDFDISFQLSFFATMSLILYADRLENLWPDLRSAANPLFQKRSFPSEKEEWQLSKSRRLGLAIINFAREGVLTTLAAQVITLPIIFYSFGTVSLISPLANLLIGPLIPAIMLFGFMSVVLGFLNGFLAGMVGALATVLINLMLFTVSTLAKLPMASLLLGKGQIWLALLYYLVIFRLFHKQKAEPDFVLDCALPGELISSPEFQRHRKKF
jgi:competence protein ComEC